MVAEWPLNNLPDIRTRHNRNSKPSAASYLRVRRVVDKEDFALNSAPLWVTRCDTGRHARQGTPSFTALNGLFPTCFPCPLKALLRPSTYHQLSIIIPSSKTLLGRRAAPIRGDRPARRLDSQTAHF